MSTETKHAHVIGSQSVESFREWFATRGGVVSWENQEIASGHAHEVFTPATDKQGNQTTAPGWCYGNRKALAPSDITVQFSAVLETFSGRFKARYWGPDVADGTRKRAERLCAKHGVVAGSWRWNYQGYGLVHVEILRSRFEPFTLESEVTR